MKVVTKVIPLWRTASFERSRRLWLDLPEEFSIVVLSIDKTNLLPRARRAGESRTEISVRATRSKHSQVDSADTAACKDENKSELVGGESTPTSSDCQPDGVAKSSTLTSKEPSRRNTVTGGRSSYRREFARIAKAMCTLGATNADLANEFNVAASTITEWSVAHDEFSQACKVGKNSADDRVERSLYQRAMGYDYEAEKVMQYQGRPIVGKYRKHVPADPAVAMFWLTNRRPNEWSYNPQPKAEAKPESELQTLLRQINGSRLLPKEKKSG